MSSRPTAQTPSKYQRFRMRRHQAGMKLLRLWVPDPMAPSFIGEAKRQAALLRGAPEEIEALRFIEAVADRGDAPA